MRCSFSVVHATAIYSSSHSRCSNVVNLPAPTRTLDREMRSNDMNQTLIACSNLLRCLEGSYMSEIGLLTCWPVSSIQVPALCWAWTYSESILLHRSSMLRLPAPALRIISKHFIPTDLPVSSVRNFFMLGVHGMIAHSGTQPCWQE